MSKTTTHQNTEQQRMQKLCRYIETHSEQPLTLSQLANVAHISAAHLQRRFKAVIGVSPKEYLESCRMKKLKSSLRQNGSTKKESVTAAIYAAGFGSPSRVYERVDSHLGMTPKQYGARGKQINISYAVTDTVLGKMLIAATDRGLCFLEFGDSPKLLVGELKAEFPEAQLQPMDSTHGEQFAAWMKALDEYFAGQRTTFDLPLDVHGTAFQHKVWKYLQRIPTGSTKTYTQVAAAIGHPKAVRAVASACARNNVSIVIPCHRVIRGSGSLAGYRWGLERKRALLELERNATALAKSKK